MEAGEQEISSSLNLDRWIQVKFEGIAGDPVTNTGPIDYFAYAIADDIFTNCDIANNYGKEIYTHGIEVSTQSPSHVLASFNNISAILALLISSGSSGMTNFAKLQNTGDAISRHVLSEAHGRYNDPALSYFGGKTAVGHSLNHLNYWGARV